MNTTGSPGAATTERDGARTHIFLQPIAAPAVLGNLAGAAAFLLFGVWFAGAMGGRTSAMAMWPFILLFGGIGQVAAGVMSIRARDAVGMGTFMSWGAFWIGYGFLWLLDVTHTITLPLFTSGFGSLGQWFMYMAVISWTLAIAALGRSPGEFVSTALAATGATITCASLMAGGAGWQHVGGWVFVAGSAVMFYHATALTLNALYGKVILPQLSLNPEANKLGASPLSPVEFEHGEPGVKVGQ